MEPRRSESLSDSRKGIPTVSAILDDGRIVEMLYSPTEHRTQFAIWHGDNFALEDAVAISDTRRLVPFSPNNNLLKNDIVLFPTCPEDYGSIQALLAEIQEFLHQYVNVSPLFEKIAAYYVLLSWVYDAFNELPYLRMRGDPGSGKTRFLLVVGALCYKPIFASGASTVSPLFRMLDIFRGTLIIDEGDFRMSDEKSELVKILNNGNAKGFPVLRSEVTPTKEFNPRAYAVFGPKIVATRGFFEDRALESRFLTEETGQTRLRDDIPINLPPEYKEEAQHLRNKLLRFRFENYRRHTPSESLVDRSIAPRLNQIFVPLLSIIEDPETRVEIRELARQYNREMIAERGMDMEAQVLEVIRDMCASPYESRLSTKDITSMFIDRHGMDYDRKITTRWIGTVIRKKLHLRTKKTHGVHVVLPSEIPKLDELYRKFGVDAADESESAEEVTATDRGALGDLGDVRN